MHELEGGEEVEENTEMKALKDAEFDQRYILDAKHTILHIYLCIHTSPPLILLIFASLKCLFSKQWHGCYGYDIFTSFLTKI